MSDITDGFGNSWPRCELGDRCGIHVVRPGHAACWCEDAKGEALALRRLNADQGLTLATLCDLVLGEDADDRSDTALIRGVSRLVRGRDELLQKLRRLENELAQANGATRWECKCGGTDCAGQRENLRLLSILSRIRSVVDHSPDMSQATRLEWVGEHLDDALGKEAQP